MNVGAYTNHLLDSEPNLSEKELQEKINGYVALCWRTETVDGKKFSLYATPENIEKLAACFSLLDEEVSFETLSGAFNKLVASGAIQTEAEQRAAQERAEQERSAANKAKYDADCSAWVDSHSTQQIKERAQSDRPFASWLRQRNVPPVVETDYDPVQLARQKNELSAQREKDKPFLNVPQCVRDFAAQYQKMPFAEVQKQMRDPQFRANVDAAAKAGIL